MLILFLKVDDEREGEPSATVNLTPKSINPAAAVALVAAAGDSVHVLALWPLFPHCEHVLGVLNGGAAIARRLLWLWKDLEENFGQEVI